MTEETIQHPLERLKQRAEEQRRRREKEVVQCDECGTEVLKNSIEEAVEVAENHNESRHDGESVATVNGIRLPDFSEEEKQQIRDGVEKLQQ